jgi:hypothetical protein
MLRLQIEVTRILLITGTSRSVWEFSGIQHFLKCHPPYLTELNVKEEASIAKCFPMYAVAPNNIAMHKHRELVGGIRHVCGYKIY